MISDQNSALIRSIPFVCILSYSAEAKLLVSLESVVFRHEADFDSERLFMMALAVMDLVAAATLVVISSIGRRRLSAAISMVLFVSFAIWHAINWNAIEHNCGCFGPGSHSPRWMSVGCLLVGLANLLELRSIKGLPATLWFLAVLGVGVASLAQARVSGAAEPRLLSLCDQKGRSVPLKDFEAALCSRILLLNGSCTKCRDLLADRAIIPGSEAERLSGYLLLAEQNSGGHTLDYLIIVSNYYLLETPVMLRLEHGLIADCIEPITLDSF